MNATPWIAAFGACLLLAHTASTTARTPEVIYDEAQLSNSLRLEMTGEIDRYLIRGVSVFLDRKLEESVQRRESEWMSVALADRASFLEQQRARLTHILGMRDSRPHTAEMQLVASTDQPALVYRGPRLSIYAVRWRAFDNVFAEGLLLRPSSNPRALVVAIPDADQTPEQLTGIAEGSEPSSSYAQILAENGCQVLVPTLVSRERNQFSWNGRRVDVTNREFLYRSAFVLGRHLIGYELQKVFAGIDWFKQQSASLPVGVIGWGEGGLLALYAGAHDERIDATCVSGHFEPRERLWEQPIDRNVFGLLNQFGDAQLATMIAPRTLIVEAATAPTVKLAGGAGAPAKIRTPTLDSVRAELAIAKRIVAQQLVGTDTANTFQLTQSGSDGDGPPFCRATTDAFQSALRIAPRLHAPLPIPTANANANDNDNDNANDTDMRTDFDPHDRLARQMREMDQHTQRQLLASHDVRREYMRGLKTDSIEVHKKAAAAYRERFANDVIGRFEEPLLPPRPRTRKAYSTERWNGYEVVLDVYPDVIAYGLLLIPKNLRPNERRPVVVCQHGLEGRPQDTIGKEGYHYYKAFAAKLADRGFVTFAPQNLYRHRDAFRVLQRKANPLGKTLFSIITPQHQQIINWLKTQPFVDGKRIGFYGLSYGGKTAMRVPALLTDYCLSICSADFNEWVDKNASTRNPRSYVWTGEYEIFEFDLGSTFNYAEMAALICPRPFMVERGHDDGVADDETVAYEFAKVRRRYDKLGIGDRCDIEWFNGPHTINENGTYAFLHQHLDWPVLLDGTR